MKIWKNNYFSVTKREFNAILALFGLLIIVFVTPELVNYFWPSTPLFTPSDEKLIEELKFIELKEKSEKRLYYSRSRMAPQLFPFDPNALDVEGWQKLGLSPKQAASIVNYRTKGGTFKKVDDLKKMYAISPDRFERLKPFVRINIAQNLTKRENDFPVRQGINKRAIPIVEINSADTLQLDQLKGIGMGFARRIINYRHRLGGFIHKEQLREVYGIDSAKFDEIKDQIDIDGGLIVKIPINAVDFEALKRHPYLTYKQMNAILNYRKQHGPFSSIADLKKILILDSKTIERITPYLQF